MNNKKVLLYYLLELLLSIFILLTIIICVLKFTILNKNYFIKILEKNNYYHELYLDINNDFDNYIRQSGFSEDVTKNIFTEKDLKNTINENINNYFLGKDIIINTDKLKDNLEKNVNNYLKSKNLTITDQDSLNQFEDEIVNFYKNKIIIHNTLLETNKKFHKLLNIINILFIGLIVLDILLFIIIKKIFKKISLTIPILTSCIIILISYIYIINRTNIQMIFIWNDYVSKIIKNIFLNIFNIFKYLSIIGIIVEIIKLVIILVKNKKS